MKTLQRLLCTFLGVPLLAPAALLAPGCAGPGSASADAPSGGSEVLVTLHDFKSASRFELASESHTDPVAYYSGERADAVRKIAEDPIMVAFVEELDRRGFDDHAQAGRAPALGTADVIRWGLEIERGGARRHWLIGTGSAPGDWKEFQVCRDMFLELYNVTVSYQSVDNPSGKAYFEERADPTGGRP
jgi:hypothetical protein